MTMTIEKVMTPIDLTPSYPCANRFTLLTALAMAAMINAPVHAELIDSSASEAVIRFPTSQASWKVKPDFEKILRHLQLSSHQDEYTLKFVLDIDPKGKITNIQLLHKSGDERLDRLAIRELQQASFYPFMQAGKAVAGRVMVPIVYKMEAGS